MHIAFLTFGMDDIVWVCSWQRDRRRWDRYGFHYRPRHWHMTDFFRKQRDNVCFKRSLVLNVFRICVATTTKIRSQVLSVEESWSWSPGKALSMQFSTLDASHCTTPPLWTQRKEWKEWLQAILKKLHYRRSKLDAWSWAHLSTKYLHDSAAVNAHALVAEGRCIDEGVTHFVACVVARPVERNCNLVGIAYNTKQVKLIWQNNSCSLLVRCTMAKAS